MYVLRNGPAPFLPFATLCTRCIVQQHPLFYILPPAPLTLCCTAGAKAADPGLFSRMSLQSYVPVGARFVLPLPVFALQFALHELSLGFALEKTLLPLIVARRRCRIARMMMVFSRSPPLSFPLCVCIPWSRPPPLTVAKKRGGAPCKATRRGRRSIFFRVVFFLFPRWYSPTSAKVKRRIRKSLEAF